MIERFISILNEAIHMFYNNDRCLIERGGMEQACVSRIYYYLQDLMKYDTELNRYDLDCEYNKNGEEAMFVNLPKKDWSLSLIHCTIKKKHAEAIYYHKPLTTGSISKLIPMAEFPVAPWNVRP